MKRRIKKKYRGVELLLCTLIFVFVLTLGFSKTAYATAPPPNDLNALTQDNNTQINDARADNNNGLSINLNNENGGISGSIKALLFLTIITLAPSILVLLTSFTRIVIVLHFTRQAVGTQTAPPNQVLIGLALFLTLFIMGPVFGEINETAIKPLDAGTITQEQAFDIGIKPLEKFMYGETQETDLNLFLEIAGIEEVIFDDAGEPTNVPITVLIPSFILSELRTAFIIGFLIYIPFILIDMVVASVLMSMGMMMLPPTTISMPFKILLFILADGWDLIIGNLVKTFY